MQWDWIGYKTEDSIEVPRMDAAFKAFNGACYVRGYCDEAHMAQFRGVGYSPAPFSMKAVLRGGIVYIPDARERFDRYDGRATTTYVPAPVQPPAWAITMVSS